MRNKVHFLVQEDGALQSRAVHGCAELAKTKSGQSGGYVCFCPQTPLWPASSSLWDPHVRTWLSFQHYSVSCVHMYMVCTHSWVHTFSHMWGYTVVWSQRFMPDIFFNFSLLYISRKGVSLYPELTNSVVNYPSLYYRQAVLGLQASHL